MGKRGIARLDGVGKLTVLEHVKPQLLVSCAEDVEFPEDRASKVHWPKATRGDHATIVDRRGGLHVRCTNVGERKQRSYTKASHGCDWSLIEANHDNLPLTPPAKFGESVRGLPIGEAVEDQHMYRALSPTRRADSGDPRRTVWQTRARR